MKNITLARYRVAVTWLKNGIHKQKKTIYLSYSDYAEALNMYKDKCKDLADHLTLISGRISIKLLDEKKPLRELIVSSTKFEIL